MQGRDFIIAAIDSSPLNRGLSGADFLDDPENVAILNGEDISLFEGSDSNDFEVHFLFKSTGRAAIDASKAALASMFEDHGAELIYGLTPIGLRHARLHARLIGGRSAGIRQTDNGPCELFVMSKELWEGKKS